MKSFSPWRAARIVTALGGKPAPEIDATDLRGDRVSLARYRNYGVRDLAIVGVSVGDMVIGCDQTAVAAVEGDHGFGELRLSLKGPGLTSVKPSSAARPAPSSSARSRPA